MTFADTYVIWIIIGLALIASEIFTGTFHLLFFGMAALLTAGLAYQTVEAAWLQTAIFGLLSVICFFVVQKRWGGRKQRESFEADKHTIITLSDNLPAHGEGTIQYQGSPWTAVNTGNKELQKGQRAIIVKTEGVKIFLQSHS